MNDTIKKSKIKQSDGQVTGLGGELFVDDLFCERPCRRAGALAWLAVRK
jgi:hypothetical protein